MSRGAACRVNRLKILHVSWPFSYSDVADIFSVFGFYRRELMETVTSNLGVIDLILQAGLLVKLVMLILAFMAVSSWAIIFLKRKLLATAAKQNEDFLTGFWGGWSVDESFTKAADFPLSPVAKSFQAAVRELRRA